MPVVYRKKDVTENIEIGDIIMISPENQRATRAVADKQGINNRLVVGICIESDNKSPIPRFLNGGSAKTSQTKIPVIDGNAKTSLKLDGGNGSIRPREIVSVESGSTQVVNVVHHVDLGDKITLSKAHPGKAEAVDICNTNRFDTRNIGKVIKYTIDREKVVCLLNIE